MKKVYYKTSLCYLIICVLIGIPPVFYLYYELKIGEGQLFIPLLFLYIVYVVFIIINAVETMVCRRKFDEIINFGHSVKARVKRVKKVCCDYDWGSRGGIMTKHYVIEAVEYSHGIENHTYYSDLISKRYAKWIPKEVEIYQYMGDCLVVWDYSKKEMVEHDFVEGGSIKASVNRNVLIGLAALFLVPEILLIPILVWEYVFLRI